MIALPVDTRSRDWAAIVAYAEARKAQVMEELRSLSVTDQERRDAAVRLDELDLMLAAPEDTRAHTLAKVEAAENNRTIY